MVPITDKEWEKLLSAKKSPEAGDFKFERSLFRLELEGVKMEEKKQMLSYDLKNGTEICIIINDNDFFVSKQ